MGQSMNIPPLTVKPEELGDVLAKMLAEATGRPQQYWREMIGPIETLPMTIDVRSNWKVHPAATGDDRFAIDQAIKLARFEYPYVG